MGQLPYWRDRPYAVVGMVLLVIGLALGFWPHGDCGSAFAPAHSTAYYLEASGDAASKCYATLTTTKPWAGWCILLGIGAAIVDVIVGRRSKAGALVPSEHDDD